MRRGRWHSVLSAFLALTLVVGLSPATALAAEELASGATSDETAAVQVPSAEEATVDAAAADEAAAGEVEAAEQEQAVEEDQVAEQEQAVTEADKTESPKAESAEQNASNDAAQPVAEAEADEPSGLKLQSDEEEGIALETITLDKYNYAYTEAPVDLLVSYVVDEDGEEVPESAYDLAYYTEEYNEDEEEYYFEPFPSVPSEPGRYFVSAIAKSGSGYVGESEKADFFIAEANDFSAADITLDETAFTYTGEPIEPMVTVILGGVELTEGYSLVYRDDNGDELESAPSEPGEYMVCAVADEDGEYQGVTYGVWFEIIDGSSLDGGYMELGRYTYSLVDGEFELEVYGVYNRLGEPVDSYELVYYTHAYDDELDEIVYTELDGAPTEPGEYSVAARGIDSYTGETVPADFELVDPCNLNGGNIYFGASVYVFNENPVNLEDVRVEDRFGDEVDSYCYELVYYDADNNELDGAPTEIGEYGVAARGIDPYSGETDVKAFRIVGENDLANAYLDIKGTYIATGKPVVLEATVCLHDDTELDASKYDLVYYQEVIDEETGESETVQLAGAPSEIGAYEVVAVAKDGSGYTGKTATEYFSIVDQYNLGSAWTNVEHVAYTGSAVVPEVTVDLAGETVSAKYYDLVFYSSVYDEEAEEWRYLQLPGAPTKVGEYLVAAKGKSPYYGESNKAIFTVYDAHDLGNAWIDMRKDTYAATGSAIVPTIDYVHMEYADGNLPESAYELVYYTEKEVWNEDEDDYDYEYEKLSGAPSEEGEYYVAARGVSPYKGETEKRRFTIVATNDLAGADIEFSGFHGGDEIGHLYAKGTNMDEKIFVMLKGEKLNASEYTLRYYSGNDEEGYEPLEGYPTETGWYTVCAEANGDTYEGQTPVGHFTLCEPNDLRLADVILSKDTYAYTGSGIVPNVVVNLDGTTVPASEYELRYCDDDWDELDGAPVDLGTYRVGVVAKKGGNYLYGAYYVLFTIEKASLKDAKVELSKASYTYNGKVQKPSVKTVGGKALKEGTDYTVSYSNAKSKNAGSYTVTVTGKGNYTGTSAKATYKIAKAANPMTAKGKTVKAKKSKKATFKTAKAFTVKKAQGKVTYKKANKAGGKKITVAKNGKITVKEGLKAGTYKVKVKVTAAGNGNYKKATKTVTVKVKVQ